MPIISMAQNSTPQTSPEGTFAVTPTGGATYSVSIDMPQGVNGLQPQVALTYNSQSGNGTAGWGFNVSGISAITRGPRDIYHDGAAEGISHGLSDAFFLDGQRLIVQEEEAGSDSVVFCPENAPYTRVVLHGHTGPTQTSIWFSVATPDGMTYEYGKGSSRQTYTNDGALKVNAWYISKAEDLTGNYIEYEYYADSYFLYPLRIKYGRVQTAEGTAYHLVKFSHELRQDKQPFVIDGCAGSMRLRLKTIETYTVYNWGEALFRKYKLSYSNPDASTYKYSRLYQVREENDRGTELPPVTFTWDGLRAFSTQPAMPSISLIESSNNYRFDGFNLLAADFNGDGLSDIIQHAHVGVGNNHNGWDYYNKYHIFLSERLSDGNIRYLNNITYTLEPTINQDKWEHSVNAPSIADFDGDGLQDILVPMWGNIYNNTFFVFRKILGKDIIGNNDYAPGIYYELQHSAQCPLHACADFDNDGKTDLVVLEKDGVDGSYAFQIYKENFVGTSLSLPFEPKKIFTADFNTDGMTDILVTGDSGYKIFWNQGGPLSLSTFSNGSCYENTTFSDYKALQMGDFNGDGCPDFLMNAPGSSKWYFLIGQGQGAFTKTEACDIDVYDQGETGKDDNSISCLVYDMDGDGKTDVLISKSVFDEHHDLFSTYYRFGHVRTRWLTSNGTALISRSVATSVREENAWPGYYTLGDFNGDGLYELLHYGYNCYNAANADVAPSLKMFRNGNFTASSGKLTSASNYGLTSFHYGTLTSPSLYTKNETSEYPVLVITPPVHVVSSVTEGNGAAGSMTTSYSYKNLRMHCQGRGMLGFSGTRAVNSTMGTVTETDAVLNNTTLLPALSVQTCTVDGSTSTTTNQYMSYYYHGTRALYHALSTSTSTDMDGHTTHVAYSYDPDRNNVLTSVVKHYYDDAETRTYYEDYVQRGQTFLPGTVVCEQEHPDCQQVYSNTTKQTYDAYGRLASKTTLFGTPKALTTSYTYDGFGNVTQTLTSGSDIETVRKTYEYDMTRRFVTRETDRDYFVTEYFYNDWGDMLRSVDKTLSARNQTTWYIRDEWGRLTSEVRPGQDSIKYEWSGNRAYSIKKTQADGSWTYSSYDTKGRETSRSAVGPMGLVSTCNTTYNNKGCATSRTTQYRGYTNVERLTYDGRGRPLTLQNDYGDEITYEYGPDWVKTVKNGRQYTKAYDSWGNIKESTDPVSSVAYTYHSNGKPMTVASEGATITMEYDAAGNQTHMADPDAGSMTYSYDAMGRIVCQTDARGVQKCYTYNAQGQVAQLTVGSKTTTYTYGQSATDKGLLLSEARGNYVANYLYNNSNRLIREQRTFNTEGTRTIYYSYNNKGLISSKTFPGGLTISYEYDAYGNLTKMYSGSRCLYEFVYYESDETYEKLGPNIQRISTYDWKGRLDATSSERSDNYAQVFTTLDYWYDSNNNLGWKRFNSVEMDSYEYDDLDRLVRVYGSNSETPTQECAYLDNGNIAYKSDFGFYDYDSSRPHAVKTVEAAPGATVFPTYEYYITVDDNGKVSLIEDYDHPRGASYSYGPDDERWESDCGIYFHEYEEREVNGHIHRFVYLDKGVLFVTDDNDEYHLYFMNRDNLGSILEVCDEEGNLVFKANYDAWGRQTVTRNDIGFYRGYTGHEMIPGFDLINMNGRVYDPVSARFLSPDNYVQEPWNSQNFNRYSYCLNNPLKYTDPSGERFGIDDVIAMVVGGVINLGSNLLQGNVNGFWQGLSLFGVGAVAGEAALYTGGAAPYVAAGITSVGNDLVNQGFNYGKINWGQVGTNFVMSEAMAGITCGLSGAWSGPISRYVSKLGISSPAINNMLSQSLVSGAIGATVDGSFVLINGGSGDDVLNAVLRGGGVGLTSGAVSGLAGGIRTSRSNGINPWTGKDASPQYIHLSSQSDYQDIIDCLDLQPTINRINRGDKLHYRHDGDVFYNNKNILPQVEGGYREWVVPTPTLPNYRPGPQRILTSDGMWFYTPDHYETFIRIK